MADKQIKVLLTGKDELSAVIGQANKTLTGFGNHAKTIGQNLEQVGLRLGGIGVAGQGALSRVGLDMNTLVTGAIDAEKALYGIANTAGFAGAQAKAMVGEWTLAVNQIAVATNQSQERVTAAFNDMVAKGIDPKAAVEMLKPIGQAATAAGADIQDMAAAAQASFSKLKIPVEDVGKALDIMAQSGKAGAFELRDMAGYFDKISASAANLGMKGQDSLAGLAAAAQIARRGTGDAAQAATNLDNFLSKLNAQVTYKAFDKMGVDLEKLKEEAKASGDYIGYMAQSVQKITGGDTAKVATLFSDVQAGAFIQGMLRDLEDYKKIREEALAANGVAAQDFATAMQSASAQVDKFKISSSATVNGEGIKSILDSLNSVAQWAGDNPELAKWLIFGTAGLAVGGAAIAGLGAMVTAIGGISVALGTLATFLAANPVVLTILGVAAAGAAGYALGNYLGLDEIGKKLGSFTYDVVQTLGKLPDELAALWERWKTAGAGLITSLKSGITEGLKGALGIGDKLKDALAYLTKMGGEWVEVGKQVMQGLLNGIQAKYKEIIAKIKGLGKDMLDSVKDVLGIQSPSKEFEQVGLYVAEGMSLGISKGTLGVQRSLEDMAASALATGYELQAWGDPFGGMAEDLEAIAKGAEKAEKSLAKMAQKTATAGAAATQSFRDGKGRFLPSDEAERTAEEWRRTADDMQRSLTDALMRGFEGGKDAGKNFVDTVKNYIQSAFLKPIAVKISASILGAVGMGAAGTASASSGAVGSASNLLSLGSSLGSLGSLGTMASYGTAAMSGGLLAGATQGGMLAAQTAAFGTFGATSTASALGGTAAAGGGTLGALGAAAPYLAAISVVASLFKKKPSDKAAWGTVDLATGAISDQGNMEGDKYSKENVDATVAALAASASFAGLLTKAGGTVAGSMKLQIGSRDGLRADLDGNGQFEIIAQNTEDYFKAIFASLQAGATGLDAAFGNLLTQFDGTAEELLAYAAALVDVKTTAIPALEQINQTLGGLGEEAYKAGLNLVQAAGGMQQFMSGLSAYYDTYYTEAERMADLSARLGTQFAALNLAMPETKAGFRALVESLDLTTTAGQQAFNALIGLSPGFTALVDYAETSAQAVAEVAVSLDAAFDALTRAVNAERGRINSVFDGLAQSLSAAVDGLEDRISRKTGLSEALQTALAGLLQTAGMGMSRAVADAQVQAALLIAKTGGVLPDVATLQPALDALGQDNRSQYATRTDYLRDQMRSAAALDSLKKITDTQLSTDELALAALNTQIEETLRWKNDELAKLDSLIDQAKMQVDASKGIDTSILSLADALAQFNGLTAGTAKTGMTGGNVVVGGGASSAGSASAAYAYGIGTSLIMPAAPSQMAKLDSINQFLTSTYDGGTAAWFEDVYAYAKENGVRQSDIAAALNLPLSDVEQAAAAMGYPKFAAGGRYAGGMALVGEYGPELINFDGGGYVHTAPQTAAMIGNGNAALIDEIVALREEVTMLRAETRATAQHTSKTARLLERAMPDGDALSTREAT